MFSRSLGGDSIRHGVRVLAVIPARSRPRSTSPNQPFGQGTVRRREPLARHHGGLADEARRHHRRGVRHGRVLASDYCNYISGSSILIDGGLLSDSAIGVRRG